MNIQIHHTHYTPSLLKMCPESIFVFGDNMKRYGKGGQAIIRDEPNAFGIATKRYPSKDDWAYFSNKADEFECVKNDLRNLWVLGKSRTIVFPLAGIGTGLAEMEKRSFDIWSCMNWILKDYFGYINGVSK